MTMKRFVMMGLGMAVIAGSAINASANTAFDQTLASPANTPVSSWYNGSGNPQGGFTVDLENGIESWNVRSCGNRPM